VARIGGDEFAILLPNTPLEGALLLINRLRVQISDAQIPALGQDARLTISAGVAARRPGASSAAQLLDHADQALLAAKRAGRDRAVAFDDVDRELREQTAAHRLTGDLIAADIMTVPLICLRQNESVQHAIEVFLELRIDSAPVLNECGELIGIVAETDLLNYALSGASWNAPIEEIVSVSVITFGEHVSVLEICRAFQRNGLRRTIILRDAEPIGLVTQDALLRLIANWAGRAVTYRPETRQDAVEMKKPDVCAIADAITHDMSQLKHDASTSCSELTPALVATATRVQEQAQKLLALSQDHVNSLRQD
jgi:CBS domain-containing protein